MSFYPNDFAMKEQVSDYMKIVEGDQKIRILMKPIIGYETWSEENKPQRFSRFEQAVNSNSRDGKVKEFHAFIVWNYELGMIQLLNITQRGIQEWIYNQTLDEDWSDPTSYDIIIKRTGKGMNDTTYSMVAKMPKPMDQSISEALKAVKINWDEYFSGGHPIIRNKDGNSTSDKKVSNGPTKENHSVSEQVADDIPF